MPDMPLKRAVYRIIARNEESGWSLVYIGQTTNLERRKAEHREGIRLAMRRPGSGPELYQKLASDKVRHLLKFEVLAEGLPTLEAALLSESEFIARHRKLSKTAVLNAVDRPGDAEMPTGRISSQKYFEEYRITVIKGLRIGDEVIGYRRDSDVREIVKLKAMRSVAFQGRESWAFEETGVRWRHGHMPPHVINRVYRGFVKGIVQRQYVATRAWLRPGRPIEDRKPPALPTVQVITKVPKRPKTERQKKEARAKRLKEQRQRVRNTCW